MAIIKWRPFQELEEFFTGRFINGQGLDLAVDVYEEGNNVIAKMNVPGIKPDDIDIKIEKHHLHIYGERKEEKEVEKKDYYHKEIRSGSFERIVPLPCLVDEKSTTAKIDNGVLIITMPKTKNEEIENKRIKVTQK